MVKSSIPEDRMSILPQNNNRIPVGESQYIDDHPTTNLPVYSNFQQYPYTMIDTQQQQLQQPEVQTTGDPQQTIAPSINFMPHLLMLQQQQQSATSQQLDNNNSNAYSNETHKNTLITPKGYDECSNGNSSNAAIQDTNTVATSLYPVNTNNFWETHSLQTLDRTNLVSNLTINVNNGNSHGGERGIAGFVSKLYQSLQAPENGQKYAHWCRHKDKDMFVIDCIPRFTEEVLPRLFKHCKFPSFVRQLNIYGFQRDTDARKSKDTKDKETCRWHHPYFRPGRRDLFHLIRRKATQNSRRKRIQQVVEEDPETIVNMESEDDYSDIGSDRFGLQQRRQSSVSSVSNSVSQQDISLPSSSSGALELQPSHQQQQQQPLQHYQHHLAPNALYQQDSATEFDLVDPLMHHQQEQQQQQQQHHHHHDPSSSLCLETTAPLAVQHSIAKVERKPSTSTPEDTYSDHHPAQNAGHMNQLLESGFGGKSSSPPTFNDISKEEHLQQQLCQLQTSYKNDRDYYTRQMHLAYSRIESQRAHIKQLEAISAQRQYQMRQQQHQQHSAPFIKREDGALLNSNLFAPATALDYFVKADPESTSTTLSSPNHLPNNQSYYSQRFEYYLDPSTTNGSSMSVSYGVSSAQKSVPTSTPSNHIKSMESQQPLL